MSGLLERTPRTVGIIGSAGAYGRWLTRFFQQHMQLKVIGHDPADPDSHTPEELLAQADVLVFSAPIRHTPALIAEYVRQSAGRERDRLWLDVTSVKEAPVQAMLASQAEVVGPPDDRSAQGADLEGPGDGGLRSAAAALAAVGRYAVHGVAG